MRLPMAHPVSLPKAHNSASSSPDRRKAVSQTERLYQIVRMLEDARQPVPLSRFLDTLEISRASFKRDLDYLRDRLGAPIVWRRGGAGEPEGYVLEGERGAAGKRFGIHGMWFNPSEIHALLMMQQLATAMEPGLLASQVDGLMTRIGLMLGSANDDPAEIGRRVRILHSANRRATPRAFDTVAQATMKRQRLALRYYTRSRNAASERVVSPQQLLHYRENWYLLAFCHQAGELRLFALDAIRHAEVQRNKAREVGSRSLRKAVGEAFGIFSGPPAATAELRFSAEVAPWVASEIWHPAQIVAQQPVVARALCRQPRTDDGDTALRRRRRSPGATSTTHRSGGEAGARSQTIWLRPPVQRWAAPASRTQEAPTASFTHFLVKLFLAAPASFFSAAAASQLAAASFSHFFMKLLLAAPASFFSAAFAAQVGPSAKAESANAERRVLTMIFFMAGSGG